MVSYIPEPKQSQGGRCRSEGGRRLRIRLEREAGLRSGRALMPHFKDLGFLLRVIGSSCRIMRFYDGVYILKISFLLHPEIEWKTNKGQTER